MKQRRLNWVDGLVLVLVVALVAGACVRFLVLDGSNSSESVDFTYELTIKNVRQVTIDALQVGDTVYDNEGKSEVGVISGIATTPAVTNISLPDGTIVQGEVEDRYDVVLTITASGEVENGAYEIGTYDIQVNQTATYFTKYSIWSATVTALGDAA